MESFFSKVTGCKPETLPKMIASQVFSCEVFKIFWKNHLQNTLRQIRKLTTSLYFPKHNFFLGGIRTLKEIGNDFS